MSSLDSWDGDGYVDGGHEGTQLEEEALEASLMRKISHDSRPSSSPSTGCWLHLSDFESPTCELVRP